MHLSTFLQDSLAAVKLIVVSVKTEDGEVGGLGVFDDKGYHGVAVGGILQCMINPDLLNTSIDLFTLCKSNSGEAHNHRDGHKQR